MRPPRIARILDPDAPERPFGLRPNATSRRGFDDSGSIPPSSEFDAGVEKEPSPNPPNRSGRSGRQKCRAAVRTSAAVRARTKSGWNRGGNAGRLGINPHSRFRLPSVSRNPPSVDQEISSVSESRIVRDDSTGRLPRTCYPGDVARVDMGVGHASRPGSSPRTTDRERTLSGPTTLRHRETHEVSERSSPCTADSADRAQEANAASRPRKRIRFIGGIPEGAHNSKRG